MDALALKPTEPLDPNRDEADADVVTATVDAGA